MSATGARDPDEPRKAPASPERSAGQGVPSSGRKPTAPGAAESGPAPRGSDAELLLRLREWALRHEQVKAVMDRRLNVSEGTLRLAFTR